MHSIRQGGSVQGLWSPFNRIKSTNSRYSHAATNYRALSSLGPKLSYFTLQSHRCRRHSSSPFATIQASSDIPITFTITRKINYGETHRIVGNHPSLGNWKIKNAPQMSWSDGDRWHVQISLPRNSTIEFKCVRAFDNGDPEWEPGNNHQITITGDNDVVGVTIELNWGNQASNIITQHTSDGQSNTITSSSSSSTQYIDTNNNDDISTVPYTENTINSMDAIPTGKESQQLSSSSSSSLSSDAEDMLLPSRQWIGKDAVFMRSNQHSTEREGLWNTDGLDGPALHLVQGDESAGSWLAKLGNVKSLLVDAARAMRPDINALSHAYIYLTWVATGALPCVEQGGHRRPNHHANLGQITFRSLEWVIGDRPGTIDAIIARRLHTRLPAFDEQFTQGTPLTRIRDIAHRNDIPQELKQEIKHTIQNKLHRNAGPEDLVATEALLARVTATPGEYSQSFIDELKLFVVELKEFFNAGSLSDLLMTIRPVLDDASAQIIDRFIAAKKVVDDGAVTVVVSNSADGDNSSINDSNTSGDNNNTNGATTITRSVDENALMDALHSSTSIRALIASGLSSGLRNDAPDRALSMRQKWRLAEIKAEDYVFVLMSRFINVLEEKGGASYLAQGTDATWSLPIGALVIGLRHIGLSGFDPGECMALEKELASWQRLGGFSHSEESLRLRATLQRVVRLTESYCNVLLDTLTDPARVLGQALGVSEERYNVFVEAEIRSHVVFQLSKLAGMMIKGTGVVAGVTPWNVLVAGAAQGVLLAVPRLDPGCLNQAQGKDAVLLVEGATGDEEVAALGSNLRGIILQQDIPHLSHLGVRARQENVPFITCEDRETVDKVLMETGLIGRVVKVVARVDGVEITEASDGDGGDNEMVVDSNTTSPNTTTTTTNNNNNNTITIKKSKILGYIPLESATIQTCGAKATACSKLSIIAHDSASVLQTTGRGDGAPLFEVPRGVVLPFGSMELILEERENRKIAEKLKELIDRAETIALQSYTNNNTNTNNTIDSIDELCNDITTTIHSLSIPETLLQTLANAFDPASTIILRSSANVEDLQGMSGAGLYESIPNIDPMNTTMVKQALCSVWASLYSRRAVLARAAAGLDPGTACMAVLVQEQVAPELSFVLHTAHPLTKDDSILVAEIAPGMGETLASGTRGSGWMLEVERENGKVKTKSFANFSRAFMPSSSSRSKSMSMSVYNTTSSASMSFSDSNGNGFDDEQGRKASMVNTSGSSSDGNSSGVDTSAAVVMGVVSLQTVDYSEQELSWSGDVRESLGKRLAIVGRLLEHEFDGVAQDVEGCVVDGRVFVVQSRPQP